MLFCYNGGSGWTSNLSTKRPPRPPPRRRRIGGSNGGADNHIACPITSPLSTGARSETLVKMLLLMRDSARVSASTGFIAHAI